MVAVGVVLMTTLSACSDSAPNDSNFDRKAMLTAFADRTIIPAYDALVQRSGALESAVHDLIMDPTSANLVSCRTAWTAVAESWQASVSYDLGPAEGAFGSLSMDVGTFPASPEKIEAAIAAADTLLQNFDRDARGLYGVDYLLYHRPLQEVADEFRSNPVRGAYLTAVVNKMLQEVTHVSDAWKNGYREQFIAQSGTDAGSGSSLLFNHMNMSFELLKNYKLGLPLGRIAGQTASEPTKVEAYYSAASLHLMRLHYNHVVDIWYGRTSDGTEFPGFRDYLLTVVNGQHLIDETELQMMAVKGAFDALDDGEVMSDLITSDPSRLETLHTEMQKLTRFLKSEMSSLLGISITYSSGDGD